MHSDRLTWTKGEREVRCIQLAQEYAWMARQPKEKCSSYLFRFEKYLHNFLKEEFLWDKF
jgi:hypothetical protein